MNSRCKKKITPICQHFKLPLQQILHLAFVQSQSHIGYTHSCKVKGARKGPWIWHVIVCTAKLVGHSLASSWPGHTDPFPRLQLQLRRGSPADTMARRALAARHALGKGSPPQPGGTAWPRWPQCPGMLLPSHLREMFTAGMAAWVLSVCHNPSLTLCSQAREADTDTNTRVTAWSNSVSAFLQQKQTRLADPWEEANTDRNKPRWYKFAFAQRRSSSSTYSHLLFWGQLRVFNTHTVSEKQTQTIWGQAVSDWDMHVYSVCLQRRGWHNNELVHFSTSAFFWYLLS